MEDTIVKDVKYYEDNREEATKKAKWCFEKFNLEEEKILEEVKAGKNIHMI
ncbi:hypothetical protein [Campylobacter helveticus]|uniref:hypothetical protein n=1 Tax=Campylobacter helveticus TaxID=28898 RepID=UPI001486FC3E|nr:hypothetical protein [Campylobacter helveticus]